MGTVCAPVCKAPISIMFHSVLLLLEIKAILSSFFTPNLIRALEIVFAFAIYSSVDVFSHTPLYLVTKASEMGYCSN